MLQNFYPKSYCKSAYDVDYQKYRDAGYCGIIFDIDNTLVYDGAPADERCQQLIIRLKRMGYKLCLLSNNIEERVAAFAEQIDVPYIYRARKPSVRGYLDALNEINTHVYNTIFIGDQIFTDIYGANKLGLRSILVRPLSKNEDIRVALKRVPEKLVIRSYLKARN